MSIYDHAHALARSIKESPEFKNFQQAQEKLEQDKSAKEMLVGFRKAQWELQKQKLAGLEIAPEHSQKLSQLMEIIGLNLLVKDYLETEYRFSLMVADIQKIIGEALAPLLSTEIMQELQEQPLANDPGEGSSEEQHETITPNEKTEG